MSDALIIQQPAGRSEQLILLFHGVGTDVRDMAPLGEHLAGEFPQAFVVGVNGGQAADRGTGRQWFSVREITEENRISRIEEAMPGFVSCIRHWQRVSGVGAEGTALVGFSQGAIMALESTRIRPLMAGRVVSIAGRFARHPEGAVRGVTFHLLHGKDDHVIPYSHTVYAAERLISLGGDVTADVVPFAGHEINTEIAELLVDRLKGYLPRRCWEEAMLADRMPAIG